MNSGSESASYKKMIPEFRIRIQIQYKWIHDTVPARIQILKNKNCYKLNKDTYKIVANA